MAHSAYYNDMEADKFLKASQQRSGLEFEITGRIGIRRKFQTYHIPQVGLFCRILPRFDFLANSRAKLN